MVEESALVRVEFNSIHNHIRTAGDMPDPLLRITSLPRCGRAPWNHPARLRGEGVTFVAEGHDLALPKQRAGGVPQCPQTAQRAPPRSGLASHSPTPPARPWASPPQLSGRSRTGRADMWPERRQRPDVSRTEQQQVVERFLAALTTGDVHGLMDVLAPDVVLLPDGRRQPAW